MRKKGQITIYLIIGFFILFVIGGVLFLRQNIVEKIQEEKITEVSSVPKQLENVKDDIKSCVDNFLRDSVYYLAVKGGTFSDNIETFDFSGNEITYLIKNKKSLLPSNSDLQNSLSSFINENLEIVCGGQEGVEYQKVDSKVEIENDSMFIIVNWPIKLTKGSITGKIDQFSFTYNNRLGEVRDVAEELIDNQIIFYPSLCLSCMAGIANSENVVLERYIQGNTQIFMINDNTDERLVFIYGVDYNGQ